MKVTIELHKTNRFIELIPNTLIYHTSNPFFRDKISKKGLLPKGKSANWLSDTKIDGKVIFAVNSDNPEDWWDSGFDDDLYRIDTTTIKNKWYYDPNFLNGVYKNNKLDRIITFDPIPLNAIEMLYKGTGDNLDNKGVAYYKCWSHE